MEKLLSDPTSIITWLVLAFFITKDVYLWIKNKGIPSFEEAIKRVEYVSDKLDKMQYNNDQIKMLITGLQSELEDISESSKNTNNIVKELYQWHSVVNEDGVRLWYIRPSLERTLEKLRDSIDNQTSLSKELVNEFKMLNNELHKK